jgi:hypothetical protein
MIGGTQITCGEVPLPKFRDSILLPFTLKVEEVYSSENFVIIY